jgi:hypothetical protein
MPTVALRRCMESTGDLAEGETAKLRLVFTIGKDGHVTKADVDGPADHHRLAACVEKRLAAWTFPVELPAPAMFRMSMMCIAR